MKERLQSINKNNEKKNGASKKWSIKGSQMPKSKLEKMAVPGYQEFVVQVTQYWYSCTANILLVELYDGTY